MSEQLFVPCLAWIAPGFAARVPQQIELDPEEMAQLRAQPQVADGIRDDMDAQLEDEDDLPTFGQGLTDTPNDAYPLAIDDLSDEEKEDYLIRDTDHLIVAGKVEQEQSGLEVYVFQRETNNLYVHHELMLSSFPLDINWLKVSLGSLSSGSAERGNFAVVSTFLPEIQIWNLDTVEAIEPELTLGGQSQSKRKKPKKFTNTVKKYKEGSHTDSVLTLSLNHSNLTVLASGSADNTVKIWDLNQGINVYTSTHHEDQVQKVAWNSVDKTILLSASADGTIAILDSRFPDDRLVHRVQVGHKIESASWNQSNSTQFAYCTDQGFVSVLDARMPKAPLDHFQAHTKSVTGISIGSRNLMYTCSEDGYARAWNLLNLSGPVATQNPKCGKLFCISVYEEADGPIVACGNSKGELFVWDVTENQTVNSLWTK